MRYDLLVIGNSPAGHQAALAASSLNKSVAIAHAPRAIGSELDLVGNPTLRFDQIHDALLDTPELLQGIRRTRSRRFPSVDLESTRNQLTHLIARDRKNSREQLRQQHVSTFAGDVSFLSPHEVSVGQGGSTCVI